MRNREVAVLLTVLLLFCGAAIAQPMPPIDRQMQSTVFLAGAGFPGTDSSTARVDIVYSIEHEFFVPFRAVDSAAASPFLRTGEILIELLDSTGVSAAREIVQISISEHRADPASDERLRYEGIASFTVPPGRYKVLFEATDRQSKRRLLQPERMVEAASGRRSPFTLYPVWFVSPSGADRFLIDSFGRDMEFSTHRELLLAMLIPQDTLTGMSVDYQVGVSERDEPPVTSLVADTIAWIPLIRDRELTISKTDRTPHYQLTESPGNRVAYLAIPLRTEQLPLRTYMLTVNVRAGGQMATVKRPFRNVWPAMPQSLKNLDMAYEALRFIASEATIDSLKSGNFETRRDNLERYWTTKDASPGTAMNEVMAEYYRRVDRARREFATLREQDGTKTDRGRIFVLYGPPTRTERSLTPGGAYTETWVFEHSKRQFTFVDEQRNGTYVLSPSKP
jgi:GWxTD domain-containing protein